MPDDADIGISIRGLRKTFRGDRGEHVAIDRLDLDIARGTAVALLGPSGCGKTTTLRCVAGLETAESGTILVNGNTVFHRDSAGGMSVPPERRNVGLVFQSYALWPHMTVEENVRFPLVVRRSRGSEADIAVKVATTLQMVGCAELAHRYPGQLSGGQQQRVSLARALVADSLAVLFDEPLSNLDAALREEMRFELASMQSNLGFTALYVTHDQSEAMAIASQVAIMFDGRIAQMGSPHEVYDTPATPTIASFIGSPVFIDGELCGDAQGTHAEVDTKLGRFWGRFASPAAKAAMAGTAVTVCIRPERLQIQWDEGPGHESRSGGNRLAAKMGFLTYLGPRSVISVVSNGIELRTETYWQPGDPARRLRRGEPVNLALDRDSTLFYPRQVTGAAGTQSGRRSPVEGPLEPAS